MSQHALFIDITRHVGLTQSVISSAQAYSSRFEPDVQEWFVLEEQKQHFDSPTLGKVTVVNSNTDLWSTIIKQRVLNIGEADPGRVCHILSYNRQVRLSAAQMSNKNRLVHSLSLGTLHTNSPIRPQSGPQVVPQPSAIGSISVAEAIQLTKSVMARHGYLSAEKPLALPHLRPLLVEYDKRIVKNASDPISRNLIARIVEDGVTHKWLTRGTTGPGSDVIWLNGVERLKQITTNVQPESAPASLSPVASAPPIAGSNGDLDEGRARTRQMIKCLKDRRIYSPKTIRDYIFKALRTHMGAGQLFPITASQLIRRARTEAEKDAAANQVTFDFWAVAGDAVLETMILAGVLQGDDGKLIEPGLHARGAAVSSVAPDLEDRCEMYMMEFLIKSLKDVTQYDRTAIAHALFKVARAEKTLDDMQDRVDTLFFKLRFKLSEDANGHLFIDDSTQDAV